LLLNAMVLEWRWQKTNKMESESSPIVLTSGDNKYK
jgi:hypothetical protein